MPRKQLPYYVPHVLQALGYLNDTKGSTMEAIIKEVRREMGAENIKELLRQQNDEVTKAVMHCVKDGILIKQANRIMFNLDTVSDESTSQSSSSKDTSVKRTHKTSVKRAQTRKRQRRSTSRTFRLAKLFDATGSLCSCCAREYKLQPKKRAPQKRNARIAKHKTTYGKPHRKPPARVGRGRPKLGQPKPLSIKSSHHNDDDDDGDVGQNISEAADSNLMAVNEVNSSNPGFPCNVEQDESNKNSYTS